MPGSHALTAQSVHDCVAMHFNCVFFAELSPDLLFVAW